MVSMGLPMSTLMRRTILLLLVAMWAVVCCPPDQAGAEAPEIYRAFYGGVTLPQPFQEVRGIQNVSALTLSNLDLTQSTVIGGKLGLFLPGGDRWSGLETEFFYTSPHIKQQNITFSAPGILATTNFTGAHVRVATWAINWIIRYPGQRFQPYVGVGPGIYWGRMSGDELGTASDTSLGLNALAGSRIFLTRRLALFAEYKYNRTSFDFGRTVAIHVLYQAHLVVVGLSMHF